MSFEWQRILRVNQPWNLSKNHILKFVLNTVIKNTQWLKFFFLLFLIFSKNVHPSINIKHFQEYNISLGNISIRAFKKDHLKICWFLPEDLKLDYGENLQVKYQCHTLAIQKNKFNECTLRKGSCKISSPHPREWGGVPITKFTNIMLLI